MKITVTALYNCGMCTAPEDWNPKSIPRPYRLYYVISGKAYYSIKGEKTELLPGHFYLFPSSMPFNVTQDSENRLNHLYYDFMLSPAIVSAEPLSASLEDHPLFEPMLELMKKTVCAYRYESEARLHDSVVSILEAFLAIFSDIALPKKNVDADIVRALEYIEQSYSEDITVKSIAELVYLDEDYFIRKFKKNLGITPYAYIKNLRLAVARELRFGGQTMKSAASAVGFKCASSYCRAISKETPKVRKDI